MAGGDGRAQPVDGRRREAHREGDRPLAQAGVAENEDTTRFPGTLHWKVRDNVRRLLKHLADSLGEGAAAPLAQLPRGSPERRAAAERLGIREPHEEKTAAEREFGAAFAEALENGPPRTGKTPRRAG